MPQIIPTDHTIYWTAKQAGMLVHIGETPPEAITASGHELTQADNENGLLNDLVGFESEFPALPAQGEAVEAKQIYNYDGTLVMARQSHTRTEHDPAAIPALFVIHQIEGDGYLDWVIGEYLEKGKIRRYNNQLYVVTSPLLTVAGQTPDIVPAHYQPYVPPGDTWTDSGATYQGVIGAGVCNVSDTSPFGAGQSIRIGTVETSVVSIWTPGAPGVLQFPVGDTMALDAVANGTMIEIQQ